VGADDNASGTASVIALAEALSKQPQRKRHLLIALWSAEEIGLIGSKAFVSAPPVPVSQIAAYVNFDMVGRMKDNRLAAQATGTSPLWTSMIERANVRAGFDIAIQPDPYQPTDVSSFNEAGVPSLNFTTGAHTDYHKPSDTADKINYEDLDRVVDLAAGVTRQLLDLDAPPQFTKVEQSSQTVSRTGLRVFTGTVPDYTAEAKGLLLSAVVAGGPAEKAGLQKGDVIVEIAGQSITNIYDYTFALELLKIDQPVKVVYTRAGKRVEATLIPTARR
jgi:Zn-dependent M28 family amino/carboxypeptidase